MSTSIENATHVENLSIMESISNGFALFWVNRDLLMLETHLVGTALATIYFASLASLRRPPSANPPKKPKKGAKKKEDDEVQGLQPSDAILFPLLAGTILIGLYYLITWLEDPAILNKILGIYFSTVSLASIGKLFADGFNFFTNFVFPDVWRATDGTVYHFDTEKKLQYRISDSGEKTFDEARKTPFPGEVCSLLSLSEGTRRFLWERRHILKEYWMIRLVFHGSEESMDVKFGHMSGFVVAIVVNVVYYQTKLNFLSNLMGIGISYVGIMMMSTTTFLTGTMVLFGLFFYDIYMVFFTPYMVTVATQLDVPIKLVFDGPRSSMLGLGDIVIPGLFVAMCLRFDHFLYYYRQQKFVSVDLTTKSESEGQTTTTKDTKQMLVKPEYADPKEQWANWFWTSKKGHAHATPGVKSSSFPRTYFYASLFGYLLGMSVTLTSLLVFNHAQPALLYLVPGVVGAAWITALFRGELKEMWIYTEDGSLDKTEQVVEVDGEGQVIKEVDVGNKDLEEKGKDEKDGKGTRGAEQSDEAKENTTVCIAPHKSRFGPRTVFAFTIEAPDSLVVDKN